MEHQHEARLANAAAPETVLVVQEVASSTSTTTTCHSSKAAYQHSSTTTALKTEVCSASRGIQQLSLQRVESRAQSAFLCSLPSPASPSPFSMPLASLVGELQHALPPAAVSPEDVALLAQGKAPHSKQVSPPTQPLQQQDTVVNPAAEQAVATAAAVETVVAFSTRRVVVQAAQGDAVAPSANTDRAECACPGPGPGGASEPISCSKPRLPSTATSLASIAAASASQGALPAAPPHGVKAVCGKRAKMEDAFSVQCNFADVHLTTTLDFANKLPARIASQVGEQLEVGIPSQPQTATASGSPPASVPLSPNSAFATSALAHTVGVEASAGGSATTACSTYASTANTCASSNSGGDASDGSSSSGSGSGSGACPDTLHFFAVYDGHGGVEAAQHCATRLHHHLSAALALIAGANVHTQDAFCMANRTQGPDGTTTTTSIQCEAEWTLCPSPMPANPERSNDSIVAPPPGVSALRAAHINPNPIMEEPSQPEQSGDSVIATSHLQQHRSQAQHNVERFFSSRDAADANGEGVDAPPAPPSPLPCDSTNAGGPGAACDGGNAGTGAASEGDTASSHSGVGDGSGAARSESASANSDRSACCMSEALEAALRSAFLRTDEEFAEDGSSAMVGSTAVVALVGSKKIWIANCGDSRAVLCRGGRAIQVTDDHKPEREDEAERVEKAGGQVLYWNGHRVMGVLAMSRAIGDHGLRPYVIPEPEITVLSRVGEDDFLLLASDGLWDVMSNQEAITLAMRCLQRSYDKGTSRKAAVRVAATVLTRAAVDRGSKDNVTVLIVDLKAPHNQAGGGCGGAGPLGAGSPSVALPGCGTADLAAACCAEEGVAAGPLMSGGVPVLLGRPAHGSAPRVPSGLGPGGARRVSPDGSPGEGANGAGAGFPHRLSRGMADVAAAIVSGGADEDGKCGEGREAEGERAQPQALSFQDTVVAPPGALEEAAALARSLMAAGGNGLTV